jgi:hypothetical protein
MTEHCSQSYQRLSTGSGLFFDTGPATGLVPLAAGFCAAGSRSNRRRPIGSPVFESRRSLKPENRIVSELTASHRKTTNHTTARKHPCRAFTISWVQQRVCRGLTNEEEALRRVVLFVFVFLKFLVLLAEPFDPTGGVDQFLFSGKKRMAFGTNFDPDILLGRPGCDLVTASTLDGRLKIVGMDVCFHINFNPLLCRLGIHRCKKKLIICGSAHFFK